MLKKQLDALVADELACSTTEIATVTTLFLQRVLEAVAAGKVVVLPGFGRFSPVVSKYVGARNLLQNKTKGKVATRRSTSTQVHFAKSRLAFQRLRDERRNTDGKVRR